MSRSACEYDAVVVGSGPNGLAAAIALAAAGWRVLLREAHRRVGGGMRTAELTLPGFRHDVCSAIHPLGVASPFFRSLPLEQLGLEWIRPPVAVAHPLAEGAAAAMLLGFEETATGLGDDGDAYRRLLLPLVERTDELLAELLKPPRPSLRMGLLARFACRGLGSAQRLAERHFEQEATQGMFAGMAAHAIVPLDFRLTAAVGLMFCLTVHANGWPFPRGGSQALADALARHFESLGGKIETEAPVSRLSDLPASSAILFDLSPRQVLSIADDQLPPAYRRRLERFRYGPGVFKVDYALSQPVPWTAEACRQAGTVHVGGTLAEIAAAEKDAWEGRIAEHPFVLVAQQSLFDRTRAPDHQHTLWAYCHVPNGSGVDMTERIEAQIERFAPGFRDVIVAKHVFTPAKFEAYNGNYIGGDIAGGAMDLSQAIARPVYHWDPYSTPNPRLFLCSASTPPGPGVHGMCGLHAARSVLRRVRRAN
jgi:phytoene dehydrogenase-like protein